MTHETKEWYGVKLLFTYTLVGEPIPALVDALFEPDVRAYEESIVLLQAESADRAYELADQWAKQRETDYSNTYGQQVLVRLYDALDCYQVDLEEGQTLVSGVEVYSTIIEGKASQELTTFIDQAFPIQPGHKHMFLNRRFNG
ncbi:DUF4288 domain-containing protein [Hymenobacter volaticus]|uniref:DUF4288 domain-containing protein n=1 Tax=Hymenobacter volaticus TaxID=2932254 RepID=A0ABY4GER8_9BACT|nr:DUF4288 domain-containing protein [Hymenobacter volaticus]UOQ69290.1 DUF4288 domain-containing protein [Hymenobacter volaticus]UOQ69321.1 DUF4288 domain-containing protein [Hymenobacter volaticus]